jgi:SAM-dependent methyltransferase
MTASSGPKPNFDFIARPYRWLEYLTFGRALERCRLYFLPHLATRTRALVLGDGDGRFLSRLLTANPLLTVDAVDTSAAMLTLLTRRCEASASRIITHQADALESVQKIVCSNMHDGQPACDLVVTHFFLDCLTQSEVDSLAAAIAPHLAPDALWLLSDFRIPSGPMHLPARILVRALYLAFRIVTGIRADQLPDHAASLTRAGCTRIACQEFLLGLLTTELWSIQANSQPVPLE